MFYHFLLILSLLVHDKPHKKVWWTLPATEIRDTTNNYIIIHYDSGNSISGVIRYLRKKRNSYHYIIDRSGKLYPLIDPKFKANHAGISEINGMWGLNWYSIGICLHNTPPQKYTEAQYVTLAKLIKSLRKRWNDITNDHILGHEDVAWPLGRKHDPGIKFDWQHLFALLQQ